MLFGGTSTIKSCSENSVFHDAIFDREDNLTEKRTSKTRQRMTTIHDEKKQIPDLITSEIVPPDAGIFDEPVRYYKANQEWAKIIEGWLTWLADVAPWYQAQEHDYPAIPAILDYLVGIDLPQYPVGSFGECEIYTTAHDICSFYPNDPFSGEIVGGVIFPLKWERFGTIKSLDLFPQWLQDFLDFFGDFAGYFDDDVFLIADDTEDTFFEQLQAIFQGASDLQLFPRLNFQFSGAGVLQIKFLQVPLGGSVFLYWDVEPTFEEIWEYIQDPSELFENFTLLELNMDLIALPPELARTRIAEIIFDEDTDHNVGALFIPQANAEPPFIYPFAGIREIRVCDNLDALTQGGKTVNRDTFRTGVIGMSTVEDICNGVLCALGNAGSYILGAINSGVSVTVNSAGELVIDDGSGTGVPTTQVAQEALNGSANQAFAGVNEFIEDFADFYTSTGGVAATMELFLASKWLLNATITEAVTDYIAYRDIPQMAPDLLLDGLIEDFFCKGIKKSTTAAWIIDNLAQNQELLLTMVQSLSDDQYNVWVSDGANNPDSDYLSFDCYRRPTFEFDIDFSVIDEENPTKHFVSVALYFGINEPRNIRFTVSGKFTAPTGEEFDLLYWKDDVGTIAQQGWQVFGFALNNGDFEVGMGPPAQLPYSATGDYAWIATMPGNNYTTFAWRVPNFSDNWQETVTGSIHVTIEDAGQAI